MKSKRYILLEVEIEHEKEADLTAICEEVEVFYDDTDAAITESTVLDVLMERPHIPGPEFD